MHGVCKCKPLTLEVFTHDELISTLTVHCELHLQVMIKLLTNASELERDPVKNQPEQHKFDETSQRICSKHDSLPLCVPLFPYI